ncbi:DUF2550 domain-containing protein [Actinomycetaceae bacterium TAE3-ERU4]|nr:DUF2550 domain-containing protein [Actinomycetaceae bacterium TAE3-ERU4]
MQPAMWFLLGFLMAVVIALAFLTLVVYIYRVRLIAHRVGSFELAIRNSTEESWTSGIGIYACEALEWHRTVSLSLRPKLKLKRGALVFSTPVFRDGGDIVEVRVTDGVTSLEIALRKSSFNALIAWSDSALPLETDIF